jgi:hypothetical protein
MIPANLNRNRVIRLVLLGLLAGVMTLTLQRWVGYSTIYADAFVANRLIIHNAVLHNEPPPGKKWDDIGGNSTNVRIVAVYLAEGLHRVTGLPVPKVYVLLDTVALFASLLVLFAYLRKWVSAPLCLVGVLYFGITAILTYQRHYFHPWDRLSLLCWLLGAIFVRDDRFGGLAVLLPVAVGVKFDIVALPVLYWLARCTRERWRSVTLRALALALLSGATMLALTRLLPGGADKLGSRTLWEFTRWQLVQNWRDFTGLWMAYPPLLAFGLPLLLASVGLRGADRFLRASFLFSICLCVPLILHTNFVEVRAEVMILVLVLPTALLGLARLLGEPGLSASRPEIRTT